MGTKDATRPASLAILMCTFRGEQFLAEQLDSICAQTYPHWKLWVSDDGSDDATLAILRAYQEKLGRDRMEVVAGPRRGFCANFLSLVCAPEIKADFYAFSDQDDIWEADKLARSLAWVSSAPADSPLLYCSRTRLVDQSGQPIGYSAMYSRPPSFANAIVQSLAGANTMLFNSVTAQILRRVGPLVDVVSHDWWVYLVVTACGGTVFYDPVPTTNYRQHANNIIGSNMSWQARLVRLRLLLKGQWRDWNERTTSALLLIQDQMTAESRLTLNLFVRGRNQWLLPRLIMFYRSGIIRQTWMGNIGLIVAAILKKM